MFVISTEDSSPSGEICGSSRDEKFGLGRRFYLVKDQQVPPLRCAPLGMRLLK
jgi:hypothetical protein